MITLTDYSALSFVVRGEKNETKQFSELFKKSGGKWNPRLNGGPGWIFSNKSRGQVENIINTPLPEPTQKDYSGGLIRVTMEGYQNCCIDMIESKVYGYLQATQKRKLADEKKAYQDLLDSITTTTPDAIVPPPIRFPLSIKMEKIQ